MKKRFYSGLLLLLSVGQMFGQTGIRGKITDEKTGESLIGATVVITGTTRGTITDIDGNYTLNLDPGTYSLAAQYVSYENQEVNGVVVEITGYTTLNFELSEAVTEIESVEIVAKANRESENLLMIEQKKANLQIEAIGADELSRKGAGDVAAGIKKMTGVSMSGSRNLFVRGLGDRYNAVMLNGMPLISPDPLRKIIKLDIFPTDIVKVLEVNKVLSSRNFADYTGALINIETKDYPEKGFLRISTGLKYSANSTFKNYSGIESNGLGYFGLDVGKRLELTPEKYLELNRLMQIGEDFNYGSFNYYTNKAKPNIDIGISGGSLYNLSDNKKIGVMFGTSFSNEASVYKNVIDINTNRQNNQKARFFNDEYNYSSLLSGIANISYLNGTKDIIKYNLMVFNNGDDVFKIKNGKDEDWGEGNYQSRISMYSNYRLINNQLIGEHSLNETSNINWKLGYGYSQYTVPDRREIIFRVDSEPKEFLTLNPGNDTKRVIVKQNANTISGGINYLRKTLNKKGELLLGTDALLGKIDYDSYMFGYVFQSLQQIKNANISISDIDPYLSDPNVLREVKSNSNDNMGYLGQKGIYAGFLDFTYYFNSKVTMNVGLRGEYSIMDIRSLTLNLENSNEKDYIFSNFDLFPALNLKYQLTDNSNLRFASSRTVTRPSFFEKTPAQLIPEPGHYTTAGTPMTKGEASNNEPYLENSYSINADLKYEMFPKSGEIISFTFYGKQIKEPIESVSILLMLLIPLKTSLKMLMLLVLNLNSRSISGDFTRALTHHMFTHW